MTNVAKLGSGWRCEQALRTAALLYERVLEGSDERAIELTWFAVEGMLAASVSRQPEDIEWALNGCAALEKEYPDIRDVVGAARISVRSLDDGDQSTRVTDSPFRFAAKSLSSVTRLWRRRIRSKVADHRESSTVLALWRALAEAATKPDLVTSRDLADGFEVIGASLVDLDSEYAHPLSAMRRIP